MFIIIHNSVAGSNNIRIRSWQKKFIGNWQIFSSTHGVALRNSKFYRVAGFLYGCDCENICFDARIRSANICDCMNYEVCKSLLNMSWNKSNPDDLPNPEWRN